MLVVGTSKVEMLRLRMYGVRMCRKKILKEMCRNSMNNKGKGIAQESKHDYQRKNHKSRQEGFDEDILNMLSEASQNEISFLKTQVMSFREREDDRERESPSKEICKMSSSQETTLYEIFNFSGFHKDAGGSGGSASGEASKAHMELRISRFLRWLMKEIMTKLWFISSMMPDTTENLASICATILNQVVRVTEDTIREVLNNGDERRHKINANMDDINQCFNRMGYVGNFKKDLVIKTMLSREWKCITHIIIVCLLNVKGGFDQMNQQWAGAMKCLVMNEPFNYSYLIYSYMLGGDVEVENVRGENVQEENIEGDMPQQHEQQGKGLQGGNVGGVEERIDFPKISKAERKALNERRKQRKHERQAPSGI
ncbi:hypothetical protein L1987_24002 [Smallanthus sonchifolius]|uniref:Uncharacterized protein n=1 Tax=Smallanthus sonchifolius TaxID=185202 RepID=A0ACB9IKP2_9ASTR|nr:hypothetical protein L1987_24002 [Smallanthus sonchifolius]